MSNIQPEVLKTLKSDTFQKIREGKKRTHVFKVDFSDINPEFVGVFRVHHPSQIENMRIGVTKAALLGGMLGVDDHTHNIAHIMATLEHVVDAKPDWFDVGSDELDYDIMQAVYFEYLDWVNSFRKRPATDTDIGDSQNTGVEIPLVDSN